MLTQNETQFFLKAQYGHRLGPAGTGAQGDLYVPHCFYQAIGSH